MSGIPIVDISPFASPTQHSDDERAATAENWDHVMSSLGFAQVCGHGVHPELIAELRLAAGRFFGLSMEDKMSFSHGSYGSKGGGYTAQGVESVARTLGGKAAPPDHVENYVFRGRPEHWGADCASDPEALPAHAPDLASVGPRYFAALEGVVAALNRMSAVALHLDQDYFDSFYSPGDCALRLAHYPPLPSPSSGGVLEGQLRYGAHTDYQGFTVLLQDHRDVGQLDAGGLEVQVAAAEHHAAAAAECSRETAGHGNETLTEQQWMAVTPKYACASVFQLVFCVACHSPVALHLCYSSKCRAGC